MRLVIPDYYDTFQCIADKCRHNCCEGGWQIELGDETAELYRKMQGEPGISLQNAIIQNEEGSWCFALQEGKCPFLNQSGLCRLYGELGEEGMGVVCREFPRFSLYYGDVKEMGIGLACEEAAGIIFRGGIPFTLTERNLDEELQEETDEKDRAYHKLLWRARQHIFEGLADERFQFPDRLKRLLFFSEELQTAINRADISFNGKLPENEPYGAGECAVNGKNVAWELADIYENLEMLEESWPERLTGIRNAIAGGGCRGFYDTVRNGAGIQYNLLAYFIYRYFMKAVYDYNVTDKIKLAVSNYVMLTAMFADAAEKKKRPPEPEEMAELAMVFSRQVEYSEENTESLCEEFNFGDLFSAQSFADLLSWLQ